MRELLLFFLFFLQAYVFHKDSEQTEAARTGKEKQFTCVWGRCDREPVSVPVTDAAHSLGCGERVSGRRSIAVIDSDTKTDF